MGYAVVMALDALKWVTDTLLDRRRAAQEGKAAAWNRVATFLDQTGDVIDATVVDFRAGRIPYGHYGRLAGLRGVFADVLFQIYDRRWESDDWRIVQAMKDALFQ